MTREQAKETKQSIVFAFYKDGKLKGFRQDTFGSIGVTPKIYNYSDEQINVVLQNIFSNIDEVNKTVEKRVEELAEEVNSNNGTVIAAMRSIFSKSSNQLSEFGEFEVRVLPCPDKIDAFTYPDQAILEWLSNPMPEAIETHKFKV